MADVIDLFSRRTLRCEDVESMLIADFIEDHYWDAMAALEGMAESESEEEFRGWREALKELVEGWPDD